MQAKTIKNTLCAKLLAIVLALALIFTMMPLAMGTAYAEEEATEQAEVVTDEADTVVDASQSEETNEAVEVVTEEDSSDIVIENNAPKEGTVSALEGETTESPKVLVKGNVLKKEATISENDFTGSIQEGLEFTGYNRKDKKGSTSGIKGVYFSDIIDYVGGLKDGAKIEKILVTTGDIDEGSSAAEVNEYEARWLLEKPDAEPGADGTYDFKNGKAVLGFDWQGKEDPGMKVFVGTFSDMKKSESGDHIINRPYWIDRIISIEFVGTVPEPKAEPAPVKDGQTVTVAGNTYTVLSTSAGTVAFTKAKNTKRAIVPVSVKVDGKTYKVTQVNANAFTGSKIKSAVVNKNVTKIKKNAFKNSKAVQLIVKTKKLKKKSVKGSLKGSKIKKVVVKVGSKKSNKKYLKKYKKYFTKKNAGKKVKVVRAK